MSKRFIHVMIITGVLLSSFLMPYQAEACTCLTAPFLTEWEGSEAIFLGTVSKVEEIEFSDGTFSYHLNLYTFENHRIWKGDDLPQIQVRSMPDSAACGYEFKQGESYMVYAYGTQDELRTSLCNYNHPTTTLRPYVLDIFRGVQRIRATFGFPQQDFLDFINARGYPHAIL